MAERLTASYQLETPLDLDRATASIAGEQSTGTFVRLPGETDEMLRRCAARIEHIEELDPAENASLLGAAEPVEAGRYRRARVEISWPIESVGLNLPTVLATVAGNLYELNAVSGLRLLDINFPDEFLRQYPGPQFGIAGTRELAGVSARPLVGTIIKPSVGLSAEETAEAVKQLCDGGIDFIKDDELQADAPHCPFEQRLRAVMNVINRHADKTGKKVMYAFNITDEPDNMVRKHDLAKAYGATCVMASLHSVGLSGLIHLRRHSQLPIHAHRNGWGYLSRHPALGFDYVAWQKFWRLAGADHMHVNGLRNKFCETDDSVVRSARECLKPMFKTPDRGCEVMPVFSSGQWAAQAPDTFEALRSVDLIYACGGGIMGHPGGIAAGVASIRQAWEAAVAGIPLERYAHTHRELAEALRRFG